MDRIYGEHFEIPEKLIFAGVKRWLIMYGVKPSVRQRFWKSIISMGV